MNTIEKVSFQTKEQLYKYMNVKLVGLIGDEKDALANLCNASALFWLLLDEINWVGFYLHKNNKLILGPFQGKPACVNIEIGKGVCGTVAEKLSTEIVKNVHDFPGHIACDSASNSEIVLPIVINNELVGVLDIDSPKLSRFDEEDKIGLEKIVNTLIKYIDFKSLL